MYFTSKRMKTYLLHFQIFQDSTVFFWALFSINARARLKYTTNSGSFSEQARSKWPQQLQIHRTNGMISTYMRSLWWSSWCCGGIRQALKTITFLPKLSSPRDTRRVVHENWSFSPQENVSNLFIMLQALLWMEQVPNCKMEKIEEQRASGCRRNVQEWA